MSGYSMIAEVGNALVKLLRSQMVPEIILNSDAIGLCSPDERGNFSLGLHLYDIKESEEVAGIRSGLHMAGENLQKYPSTFLNLYYMVTAYSSSDVKFRASEEHRILGKTIQVLGDNTIISGEYLNDVGNSLTYPIKLELLRIDNEEKLKMWNMPNLPYKLSMYYKVYPVEIESTRIKNIRRVVDVDFTVNESK